MKLKIKKISRLIPVLFLIGNIHAGFAGNPEEQKFADPFIDRSWSGQSEGGGFRAGEYDPDDPNYTDEDCIGCTSVGDATWLPFALLGLAYGVYLFNKKRKETE
jgi:hypothetical protein